jgi:hypothetical protein
MSQDIDNIKNKIRKLLALAADPSAQGQEAETAARQAAKLMAKHELDEYDCQGSKEAVHDFDLTAGEAMGSRPGKKNAKEVPLWILLIAVGISRFTNTRLQVGGGTLRFAGRRSDIELACWLHDTMVTRCYKEGQKATAGQGMTEASEWRNGYAGRIQHRLLAMALQRQEDEKEEVSPTTGTSLILVRQDLDQAMVKQFGPPPQTKKANCAMSSRGYAAGAEAHIPTNRPIAA